MQALSKTAVLLIFMLFNLSSFAEEAPELESVKHFGDYEIHFSVFNTSFLTPEVAKSYGIVRGADKALVNISVLKRGTDGEKRPVTAKVTGTETDLIHALPLNFSEVREQNALYYLAAFDIRHKTKIFFQTRVQPEGETSPINVDFSRTLYKDE